MIPTLLNNEVTAGLLPHNGKLVIINFWADWCSSCTMLKPVVAGLQKQCSELLSVININVDEQPEIAKNFDIAYIPAIVLVRDKKVLDSHTGALPLSQLKALVEQYLEEK